MPKVILTTSEELEEIISKSVQNVIREYESTKNENTDSENEEMLTTLQILLLLKISKPTLYKRMKDGTVPYRRIGRRLLFPKNEILSSISKYNVKEQN